MVAYLSPLVNAAGQPYQGPPIPLDGPDFSTSGKGVQMDPRILSVMQNAAQAFKAATGNQVELFSGVQDRSTGTVNHPGGWAVDVQLYNDKGERLPNGPAQADAMGVPLGKNFRTYEAFAQTAKDIQMRQYPELNSLFRWGGYFQAGVNPTDLMHFDITPNSALGLPPDAGEAQRMGGGTFEDGATPELAAVVKKAGGVAPESMGMTAVATKQLADLGYTGPDAIKTYQAANGLNPDGKIGPDTMLRVAQDVTPPDKIPNPYGLNDVTTALRSGDPTAIKTAMANSGQQINAAIKSGADPAKVTDQFQGALRMMVPSEQATLRATYAGSPDLQATIPPTAKGYIDAALGGSSPGASWNPTANTARPTPAVPPATLAPPRVASAGSSQSTPLTPGPSLLPQGSQPQAPRPAAMSPTADPALAGAQGLANAKAPANALAKPASLLASLGTALSGLGGSQPSAPSSPLPSDSGPPPLAFPSGPQVVMPKAPGPPAGGNSLASLLAALGGGQGAMA